MGRRPLGAVGGRWHRADRKTCWLMQDSVGQGSSPGAGHMPGHCGPPVKVGCLLGAVEQRRNAWRGYRAVAVYLQQMWWEYRLPCNILHAATYHKKSVGRLGPTRNVVVDMWLQWAAAHCAMLFNSNARCQARTATTRLRAGENESVAKPVQHKPNNNLNNSHQNKRACPGKPSGGLPDGLTGPP